jgi:hypothetical protein
METPDQVGGSFGDDRHVRDVCMGAPDYGMVDDETAGLGSQAKTMTEIRTSPSAKRGSLNDEDMF